VNRKPAFAAFFLGSKRHALLHHFPLKIRRVPTGWYTGDDCRWSTDHKRKKLFDRREDAKPIVVHLRALCPSNADSIHLEMPSADEA